MRITAHDIECKASVRVSNIDRAQGVRQLSETGRAHRSDTGMGAIMAVDDAKGVLVNFTYDGDGTATVMEGWFPPDDLSPMDVRG